MSDYKDCDDVLKFDSCPWLRTEERFQREITPYRTARQIRVSRGIDCFGSDKTRIVTKSGLGIQGT